MSTTKRMLAATKNQRVFITWPMAGLFLAGAVAIILGLRYVPFKPAPKVSDGKSSLIKAYGKSRPIELRLSGGFLPGAFMPGESGRGLVDLDELETARNLILERTTNNDLQSKLWYVRFALSEKTNAKAQEYLKELDRRFPDSAEVQNEMGVYLFEDNEIEEAIKRFDKAVELDSGMPEPIFNRAVCYRKLNLLDAAEREFSRAKKIEKDRGWAAEIEARIEEICGLLNPRQAEDKDASRLEAAIDARDMEGANRILNQSFESLWRYSVYMLPPEYIEARRNNDPARAAALLRRMESIGQIMLDSKKDSFIQEFCAYLKRTPDSEIETEGELLKGYVEGGRKANSRDPSGLALLERVSRESRKRGNIMLLALSDFGRAASLLTNYRAPEAIALLKDSLVLIEEHTWPIHRSLALLQLCNGYVRAGKPSLGLKIYHETLDLDLFQDRPATKAKALQNLGATYWMLGNFDKSFRYLQDSTNYLLTAGSTPSRIRQLYEDLVYNYLNIADIHSVTGNHPLALENIDQAARLYTFLKRGVYLAEVFALKATEETILGRFSPAEESLKRAFKGVAIENAQPGSYEEKWAQVRAGNIALLKKDWKQASYYFTMAEQKAIGKNTELHLRIKALRGLSEASTDMGQIEEARRNLDTAIRLIEGYRAEITDSRDRISYLDAVQSIFDQRVSLELESFNNAENAFDFAERSRARSLLDDLNASGRNGSSTARGTQASPLTINSARPLKLKEIQRLLPPKQVVLMYAVTPKDTFAFVVDRESIKYKKLSSSDNVEQEVKEYLADLREHNKNEGLEEINRKGANLYRNLIAPVRDWIPDNSNVCIIPDKSLNLLPMAALVNESGRYLMESLTLTNSPSASLLLDSLKKAAENPAPKNEKILVVANAKYSQEAYPLLQNIFDSESEARKAKQFYSSDSVMLVRDEATEQRIQAQIKDSDVVHFALHVLVEERSPWLAAIVLAPPEEDTAHPDGARASLQSPPGLSLALSKEVPDDPNDGLLSLSEIYNFGLTRTRLVVLSGCQSGLGQYYRGEGMVSLVRPFLASNVPTVLASLWPVNSQTTSTLMIEFHKERKENHRGAGDALRAAQISMARGQDHKYRHPYYWAPFIVVGGNN